MATVPHGAVLLAGLKELPAAAATPPAAQGGGTYPAARGTPEVREPMCDAASDAAARRARRFLRRRTVRAVGAINGAAGAPARTAAAGGGAEGASSAGDWATEGATIEFVNALRTEGREAEAWKVLAGAAAGKAADGASPTPRSGCDNGCHDGAVELRRESAPLDEATGAASRAARASKPSTLRSCASLALPVRSALRTSCINATECSDLAARRDLSKS